MPMLTPVPTRIEDILNSPSHFAIPIYQREYKWGKEEAIELIEDLETYVGMGNDNLFLGNLIFEKPKDQKTYVVDGQQRLTTILLLLIACRMRAKELGQSSLQAAIQAKISFIDSTTGDSLGCRLIASESIRDAFEHMAVDAWDGTFHSTPQKKLVKRKVNKVKPIYDTFLQRVGEYSQTELSKFLRALYDSYVGRVEVENEVEALSIFERTNARGLDLEISDLLKNYLFSKKIEGIEDLWGQVVNSSDGTMLRMLKYFYVSKNGYILKPQLYKKLKSYATDKGPKPFTEELSVFSKFYRTVKAPEKMLTKAFFEEADFPEIYEHQYRYEKINRAMEGLREFGVVQFCPPAYAAYECLVRNKGKSNPGDAKKLIQLFETFEKYHFVNNVICERVGNEVEKLYADACVTYSKATNFFKASDGLINELKSKLATEDEFIANFIILAYAPDQTSLLCYIFDRFNNFGKDPAQCTQIYNPDPKLKKRNHNIEHFWSQNLDAPWRKSNKDGIDPVDNIGNLLPLYFKDNSSLGKADPVEKIERLKGDLSSKVENLTYVTDFIQEYGPEAPSWGPDKIINRAKKMALRAYREIWNIT